MSCQSRRPRKCLTSSLRPPQETWGTSQGNRGKRKSSSMRKVIFQHLAKTAGTSLIQSLKAAFGDSICPARYDAELSPEVMLDSRFAFYHGHYSFDKVHEFKNLNPDAFAFVFL